MKYRIERTELRTRVWHIDAANEDEALEAYLEVDDDEEHITSGPVDVRVTKENEDA